MIPLLPYRMRAGGACTGDATLPSPEWVPRVMRLRKAFLLIAMACCVLRASAQGNPGSIAGTVVNDEGKAVAGATVTYGDDKPLAGRETSVRADDQGHFLIQSLQIERYSL
jgi:hypothetical protein